MFCPECGVKNAPEASFCMSCGKPVSHDGVHVVTSENASNNNSKKTNFLKTKNGKAIAGIGAGIVVIAVIATLSAQGNALPAALTACDLTSTSDGVSLDADNKTIFFDGTGEEDFDGINYSSVECVLKELKASASIFDRIGTTTSLQGVVEGSWGNYTADWTYHPDNGLDITVKVK
jgi:hypothetical protein